MVRLALARIALARIALARIALARIALTRIVLAIRVAGVIAKAEDPDSVGPASAEPDTVLLSR